jgi:hypothetical protein
MGKQTGIAEPGRFPLGTLLDPVIDRLRRELLMEFFSPG